MRIVLAMSTLCVAEGSAPTPPAQPPRLPSPPSLPPAPPMAPDAVPGFSLQAGMKGCTAKNELGVYDTGDTVASCAQRCVDYGERCISFERKEADGKCQLSSSCDQFSPPNTGTGWGFYVRDFIAPRDYRLVSASSGCTGKNEFQGPNSGATIESCAQLCLSHGEACISFEINMDTGKCQGSSTCDASNADGQSEARAQTMHARPLTSPLDSLLSSP